MKKQLVRCLLATLVVAGISACAQMNWLFEPIFGVGKPKPRLSDARTEALDKVVTKQPWETWPIGYDFKGESFIHPAVKAGDLLARDGDCSGALTRYRKAESTLLGTAQLEALLVRSASCELILAHPARALDILSRYYRKTKIPASNVHPSAALIFGYAYARQANLDQSLAWFARSYVWAKGDKELLASADLGLQLATEALADDQFNKVDDLWHSDGDMRSALARVRAIRKRPAAVGVQLKGEADRQAGVEAHDLKGLAEEGSRVVVIIPLSGNYKLLGEATKSGIELAVSAVDNALARYTFLDSNDPQAGTQLENMLVDNKVELIVGPLLAARAAEVVELGRRHAVPVLLLSKRNDVRTGDGVFRFAPTPRLQVWSLVQEAVLTFGLRNFGIVYPQDGQGQEFASEFKSAVVAQGGQISFEAGYAKGDTQRFSTLAAEIESSKVAGLFVADGVVASSQLLSNLDEGFRSSVRILGPASWDDAAQLQRSSAVFEGAIVVSLFPVIGAAPLTEQFLASYSSRYGRPPDFFAAQGYDVGALVTEALRARASTIDTSNEISFPENFDGLTGRIRVVVEGELDRTFSVREVHKGKLVAVSGAQP